MTSFLYIWKAKQRGYNFVHRAKQVAVFLYRGNLDPKRKLVVVL